PRLRPRLLRARPASRRRLGRVRHAHPRRALPRARDAGGAARARGAGHADAPAGGGPGCALPPPLHPGGDGGVREGAERGVAGRGVTATNVARWPARRANRRPRSAATTTAITG